MTASSSSCPLVLGGLAFAVPSDRPAAVVLLAGGGGPRRRAGRPSALRPRRRSPPGGWLAPRRAREGPALAAVSALFLACARLRAGLPAPRRRTATTASSCGGLLVLLSRHDHRGAGAAPRAHSGWPSRSPPSPPRRSSTSITTPAPSRRPGSTCSSARSASRWRSSARSSSPCAGAAPAGPRSLLFGDLVRAGPALSRPWVRAAFVFLLVGYGTKMGLAPLHSWKPDAYGEAPGSLGALLSGGLTNFAFLAIAPRLPGVPGGRGGGLRARRPGRARAALHGPRRRVHGRPARLQADAGLLVRRAHGHPGARGSGSAASAVAGAFFHCSTTASRRASCSSPPGTSTGPSAPRRTDECGARRGACPSPAALFLAGFLAVTGSPPFSPFFSEFAILNGAFEPAAPGSAALFLALPGHHLPRHGHDGPGRGAGRPPPTPSRPRLRRQPGSPPRRRSCSCSWCWRWGCGCPRGLADLFECRRRPRGGELTMTDAASSTASERRAGVRLAAFPSSRSTTSRSSSPSVLAAGGRMAALLRRPAGERPDARLARSSPTTRTESWPLLSTLVGASYPSLAAECPRRPAASSASSPSSTASGRMGHPWMKPVRFEPPLATARDPWGRKATVDHPPATTRSSPSRARRCTRWRSARCTPASSSRATSASSATASTSSTSRSSSATSTAASSGRSLGGPDRRTLALAESVAGDTAVGHALAYANAVEALAGCQAPPRARPSLRGVGARARAAREPRRRPRDAGGDVGFLPTAVVLRRAARRLPERPAELCGSRFGRGLVVPGGVRFDLDTGAARRLADKVQKAWGDVDAATRLFFRSPSARNRTDGTGVVHIVVVHGSRPQIEAILAAAANREPLRVRPAHHRHRDDGLRARSRAARCAAGSRRCSRSALPTRRWPARASAWRAGNFITAKPLGVRRWRRHAARRGEVRRVDADAIRQRLDDGDIVLISPLGYSPTGEIFNLALEEVATQVAVRADGAQARVPDGHRGRAQRAAGNS